MELTSIHQQGIKQVAVRGYRGTGESSTHPPGKTAERHLDGG